MVVYISELRYKQVDVWLPMKLYSVRQKHKVNYFCNINSLIFYSNQIFSEALDTDGHMLDHYFIADQTEFQKPDKQITFSDNKMQQN